MKQTRIIFRVLPTDSGWKLTRTGQRTLSRSATANLTKRQVVRVGVEFARMALKSGKLAQLVVHKRNGKIEFERTYGRDPRRTKG